MSEGLYFTFEDLEGLLPAGFLVESLDDDQSGTAAAYPQVRKDAEDAVNAPLSVRFATPVSPTEFICRTALLIAVEMCYKRRNLPDQFPYAEELKDLRATLKSMGKGETEMAPGVKPVNPSGGAVLGRVRIPDRGGLNC